MTIKAFSVPVIVAAAYGEETFMPQMPWDVGTCTDGVGVSAEFLSHSKQLYPGDADTLIRTLLMFGMIPSCILDCILNGVIHFKIPFEVIATEETLVAVSRSRQRTMAPISATYSNTIWIFCTLSSAGLTKLDYSSAQIK